MRTYGRTQIPYPANGEESSSAINYPQYQWVEIETDEGGFNDYVYLTSLIQTLRLNLGESPFYAQFGIPAKNSVLQQVAPDYYVAYIQSYYSQFFPSITISKQATSPNNTAPVYNINVVRNNGSIFQTTIGI